MSEGNEFDYVQSEGWKPKKDDVIEGTIADISEGYSAYRNQGYPILTIQRADGSSSDVHCFHEVLRTKILQLQPQIGEKIGIKFLGKSKKKGSTSESVANYIVRVHGRGQTNPYGRMLGEAIPVPDASALVEDEEDLPI